MRVWCLTLLMSTGALLIATCSSRPRYVHIGPDTLPAKSYDRPPAQSFDRSDYVIKLNQMRSFYDVPGETGYYINGGEYGFEATSFILTETHPQGGPPLHMHDSEEAHVVLNGKVAYVIGERRFVADGPYIARVPAGVPHTFLNVGNEPFNLVATFPTKSLTYKELGPNPLVTPRK